MKPVAPLMIEHRLIERMIDILEDELRQIKKSKKVNPILIENAVDFIRTYADQTHHGKEEDILFRELKKKKILPEHEEIMFELIEEHKIGRKITGELVKANEEYRQGKIETLDTIMEKLSFLVDFYPKHIEKEDKHFFIPIMKYFSKNEQDTMLEEGRVFDRKMIHKKYRNLVMEYEKDHDITPKQQQSDWIDYI
ncbi:MAG: hemerythrin domain-containing protein [Candidatus Lokiarchaeota archaeon]|nr:hemerythrin domain-containing protein [Candidatus Lokiarchaeota archaeon]